MMSENNIVLVSEYQAPDDWTPIWQKDLAKTMNPTKKVIGIEKIFEREDKCQGI